MGGLDENSTMSFSSTYPEDYERLVKLIPSSGKSDTLGGEIMRAVKHLSAAPQGIHVLDSINFLAKFHLISKDEEDLYAKVACIDESMSEPTEGKKLALETLTDRAVALLLANPDLEYVENEDNFIRAHSTATRKSARNLRLKRCSSFKR